jgi:hypothetical protein
LVSCLSRVLSIQRRDTSREVPNKSELVEEFHVKFNGEGPPVVLYPPPPPNVPEVTETESTDPPPVIGRRNSRRASRNKVKYREEVSEPLTSDVYIYREYFEALNCLVIMEVAERGLTFYFYDNQSWNCLLTMGDLYLVTQKIQNLSPGIFSFSVSATSITVRRNKSENDRSVQELYLIPLFFEDVK